MNVDTMSSQKIDPKSTSISPEVQEQQQQLRGGKATLPTSGKNPLNLISPIESSLPSVQENDFLPPISRWTSLGGLFVVGAVGTIFALTSVIQYKVTVKTQAVVRPAGELRLVQSPIEGSVINISAQANQVVKKGDVIAILDDSQLQTQKSQRQSSIGQAKLQFLQINAQIRALDNQKKAQSDRIQRIISSAEAELSRRQREYQDKTITTFTQVQETQANLKQAEKEVLKVEKELRSIEANVKSAQATLKLANSKWKRYQTVAQEGAISQNQLEEAQLAVEQQQREVEVQKANLEVHKQLIEQQKQGVESAKARWQRSKVGLDPSQAEIEIASQRIAQEKASGEATLATLEKEREALIQQRIQISKQLERDTRELEQIEIDLSKTIITATANGIISNLNLRNSGQTVSSGEEIAQIVPTNAPLKIKAGVSPQYISKLAVGQNVPMRFSACPYPDYGTLKGVVSQISEDTIKPQNGDNSAMMLNSLNQKPDMTTAFYEVTIEPKNLMLGSGKNQCAVQLGMEGRADIISREETVLKFMLRKIRLLTDA